MAGKITIGLGPVAYTPQLITTPTGSVIGPVVNSFGDLSGMTVGSVGPVGSVIDSFQGTLGDYSAQTPFGFVLNETTTITSQDSVTTFHSTLFEDFRLSAVSTYNFYTSNEQVTTEFDEESPLYRLPRYVTLTWSPAPIIRVMLAANKAFRPPDPRTPGVEPVLDIGTARTSTANGYVSPGIISALLVPPVEMQPKPSFDEDLFLSSETSAGMLAAVEFDSTDRYNTSTVGRTDERIRVNFVDPSIAGALDPNRIDVAVDQTHLSSLGALTKLAAGLEVLSEFNQDVPTRNPVPTFPAPADSPTLTYIGYVIERYTLGPDGSTVLSRTINIDDPTTVRFVDRQVRFGERYSYRIKSIVQWTTSSTTGFFGGSKLDRNPAFDTSLVSPLKQASFYSGDWSDWARVAVVDTLLPSPPDELTVRPVSHRREIHVTWRMPNDPQLDVSSLRLLRSRVVGGRYEDWTQLGEFVPANGIYIDRDVDYCEVNHTEYMYAMYSVSYHGELSVLTEKIRAKLTDRNRYHGEEPLVLVGPAGDNPMAHALGPKEPVDTELVATRRVTFYIRGSDSSLPLFKRRYVVETQSLSNGQRIETELAVDTTDVRTGPSGINRGT